MQALAKDIALKNRASVTASSIAIAAAARVVASPAPEPQVDRLDSEHVVITWNAPNPVDVYVSNKPTANPNDAKLLSRADADGRFVAAVSNRSRVYFLLGDQAAHRFIKSSERALPLEQGSNFRDLGGYEAQGGRRVRWGSIYRSGATARLSDRDMEYVRTLHPTSLVDLRSKEERQLAPSRLTALGIPYTATDYSFSELVPPGAQAPAATSAAYRSIPHVLAPQFRAIFQHLAADKGPIVFNCSAGQDRTGVAAALVLSALGVPRETIVKDYLLSTQYRHPQHETPTVDLTKYPDNPVAAMLLKREQKSEKPALSAGGSKPSPLYAPDGRPWLSDTFDEIENRWGSVDRYLEDALGIGPKELATLRARYLE